MRQMPVSTIEMVGEIRAALATFLPSRAEHEMIDNQLAAAIEQISQPLFPVRPFEDVLLSTLTMGSLRRAALRASRCLENSFSRFNKSFRATSHSAADTTSVGCSASFIFRSFRLLGCFSKKVPDDKRGD